MNKLMKQAGYYLRVNKSLVLMCFRFLIVSLSIICGMCLECSVYHDGDKTNVTLSFSILILMCIVYAIVKAAYRHHRSHYIPVPRKRYTKYMIDGYSVGSGDISEAINYLGKVEDVLESRGLVNRNMTVSGFVVIAVALFLSIHFGIDSYASYGPGYVDNKENCPIAECVPESYSLGQFKITAYCNCSLCCGKWSKYGLTKSGTVPVQGRTIAVDPSVLQLGTKVLIDGVEYVCEDVGGAIKGNHIDIYMDSHKVAQQFGVGYKEVCVRWE